jgi:hypothetical protein
MDVPKVMSGQNVSIARVGFCRKCLTIFELRSSIRDT